MSLQLSTEFSLNCGKSDVGVKETLHTAPIRMSRCGVQTVGQVHSKCCVLMENISDISEKSVAYTYYHEDGGSNYF